MKRAAVVAVLSAAGLLALAAVSLGLYAREVDSIVTGKRAEAQAELPRLIAESELFYGAMLDEPLFAASAGDDAGPWLNARFDIDGLGASPPPLVTPTCRDLLSKYASREGEIPGADLAPCDTSLFTEAMRFGRWSFNAGPRASLAAGPRRKLAVPDFSDLQTAAKIHLLKGVATGRRDAAIAEVRHFAQLLFSGEYLVNAMLGIALLRIEHRLATVCGTPNSMEPVRLEGLRKRLFALMYANNPLLVREGDAPWAREPRFLRCTAVAELAFMQRLPTLPAADGCWLENARFDLAHPFVAPAEDPFVSLSGPAALGGAMARVVAPAWAAAKEAQLVAAEQLPASGNWANATSASLERMLAN